MRIPFLLVCLFFGFFQVSAQNIETSPVLINEIGVMPINNAKYLELVVSGDPNSPTAMVNLEDWIIDNNSDANTNDSTYMVMGSCLNNIPPGTLILIYDENIPHPQINTSNDGLPNQDGVYQLSFNSACITKCVKDENYDCVSIAAPASLSTALPISQASDVMQIRSPDKNLGQAVRWGNAPFMEASDLRTTNLPSFELVSSIRMESRCDRFEYRYEGDPFDGSPGSPNSNANAFFISALSPTTPPPPPPMNFSCSGTPASLTIGGIATVNIPNDLFGLFTITVSGPWSGTLENVGPGTYEFPDLPIGSYTITVQNNVILCPRICNVLIEVAAIPVDLCAEECTAIGEENPEDMNSYSWEPSSEFQDPNLPFQDNVCPEETTTYTLNIFDENCNLIESREYEVTVNEPSEIALKVMDGSGGTCGFPVSLEATEDFVTYSWSEGSTGVDNSIEIDAVGAYAVTATDGNGCTSVAQIEISDENLSALIIKGKLEEKGFYGVPINSIAPAFNANSSFVSTTDYASQLVTIIDGSQNVADELDEFLENTFFDFIPSDQKHSYVTNNLSLCDTDPALFDQICSDLSNLELGFWAHIWENPDNAGEGMLYMLGKSPNQEGFASISEYGDMLLQEMLTETGPQEQATLDKEIIYVFQDDMADFYEFKRTPENVNRETHSYNCDLSQFQDVIAFNLAQVPIRVGEGCALTFADFGHLKVIGDPRALVAFAKNGRRYYSYGKVNQLQHSGFKYERSADYYEFPSTDIYNATNLTDVTMGEHFEVQGSCDDLKVFTSEFNGIDWSTYNMGTSGPYPTGAGSVVPLSFDDSDHGDLYESGNNISLTFPSCMPSISYEQFNTPLIIINNIDSYQGVLFLVNTISATDAWVYGSYTQGNPYTPTFYIWDCNIGAWVPYDEPVEEIKDEFNFFWAVFDAYREKGHSVLDAVGMIPVIGEPADVLNGAWYTYQKDYSNAAISYGSVLAPLAIVRISESLVVVKNANSGEVYKTVVFDGKKLEHGNLPGEFPGPGGSIPIPQPDVIALKTSSKDPAVIKKTMVDRMGKSKVIARDEPSEYIASIIINRAQEEVGFFKAWELLSEVYKGNNAKRLWDIDLIEKVVSLKSNTNFMEAISGSTDEVVQIAELKKIIKANDLAPCTSCGTSGKAHLEPIHIYLERAKNFVVAHNGSNPTQGADEVLSLMKNGQKYQIDATAQLVRYVDEGIVTDVSKFEPKLKDLLNNPFLKEGDDVLKNNVGDILESIMPLKLHELKSWKKETIQGLGGNSKFAEQLKTYVFALIDNSSTLTASENMKYSFDVRKLVDDGPFASADDAEGFITGEMRTLLSGKIDNWIEGVEEAGHQPLDLYKIFGADTYGELIDKINTFSDDVYSFIKVQ